MENLGKRLIKLRQEKANRIKSRVTQSDVAKYLGVTPQAVQKWENDNGAPRKGIHLKKLAEFLDSTPQYILFGDEDLGPISSVPVLDELQIQSANQEGILEQHKSNKYFPMEPHSSKAFIYQLTSDAMEPELKNGDYVLIDPDVKVFPGKIVLGKHLNNVLLRKYRLIGTDASHNPIYELIPLNNFYPILRSDSEAIEIIGVAIEYCRKI